MESYLNPDHYDLVTPDGAISNLQPISSTALDATVFIDKISPVFKGYDLDNNQIEFNGKSTLAQLGLDLLCKEFILDRKNSCAEVLIHIQAVNELGQAMLRYLRVGCVVGKLFAADPRRLVRNPDYLSRMFGRSDRKGRPLLSLGGMQGSNDLILDVTDGRTIAYLTLQYGRVEYPDSIFGLLPTLAKALCARQPVRSLLRLHQEWSPHANLNCEPGKLLLVRTLPLHIRTVFAKVVDKLLPQGFRHTSANVLQPDTQASGDIYELYGKSDHEISDIPLEFYTLEPHREHVFFRDRDQLQASLENPNALFKAFETGPKSEDLRAAVFVVKGEQMQNLTEKDWVVRDSLTHEFPGPTQGMRQAAMVERYIQQQPSYPFLKAIQEGLISSQGILLVRHFPSPLMKRMLLSEPVQRCLKGIYFLHPSQSMDEFFSQEDRSLLLDLATFAIPVFWVDQTNNQVLQYALKSRKGTAMFVPSEKVQSFLQATVFGIYGSNLIQGHFEDELHALLTGILEMKEESDHPMLSPKIPLALITGGGPGAMEIGNRVAQNLNILSCANIVDFRPKDGSVVNEQKQNPHVEAKMTYRLEQLVERQSEFHLDFPIFLMGGIGTDFEYCLEEVRRKVGSTSTTPILLFGTPEYWESKITSRYKQNLESGTIKGSEWISNCFYCVQNASQGLQVYREYFNNRLPIGKDSPSYPEGFVRVGIDLFSSDD
ncbi:MAG: hypothetical protein CMO81_03180 [Waddliaceae bacterium]|nr:hypothetical protein [Waddliaceae bacterium]